MQQPSTPDSLEIMAARWRCNHRIPFSSSSFFTTPHSWQKETPLYQRVIFLHSFIFFCSSPSPIIIFLNPYLFTNIKKKKSANNPSMPYPCLVLSPSLPQEKGHDDDNALGKLILTSCPCLHFHEDTSVVTVLSILSR